ncbi:MAG TPA: glycosyltransferase [Myxococcaceae bacterium]|nr:glycosyltransferase [Myxococcaceae bacterium]
MTGDPHQEHAPVELVRGRGGDALVLSMRRVADVVGYVAMYEFEDLVLELLRGDRAAPRSDAALERGRRAYKAVRLLTGSRRLGRALTPPLGSRHLERDYGLFLAVFNHPHELFNLHALADWRARSRFAACYICEAWQSQLPDYLLELLSGFDHLFLGVDGACEAVARLTGRPCTYLPMGVDALRFLPSSPTAPRGIDVCGIGRRSAVTHRALLAWASGTDRFYFYDTMRRGGPLAATTFHVIDPAEHRLLFSNLLKRSRYFIANRAWADRPALTQGKDEIAARFYEGAAAGAVMLGDPPDTDDFRSQFDWPDSVVRTPFDAPDIAATLDRLDADPARVERIRRAGVVNALRRHDWSERLLRILRVAGVAPGPELEARRARLSAIADRWTLRETGVA